MRILVDMDGVIADFERGLLDAYRAQYPDKLYIPLDQRTTFYVKEQYPDELKGLVEGIYLSQGFYLSLPPVEGSLEAMAELTARGDQVYICTSLIPDSSYCVQEKLDWVRNYLGREWINRIVITRDKTIVHGDYLIDDKPEIKGVQVPTWEHILYSQPPNAHIKSKKRMTWQNWKSVIG